MTNTASDTGREGLVDQATAQVQEAASTAQEKAVELKDQGRSKLGETLDQRTSQAGEQVRKMAQALRQSGEHMRDEGEGGHVVGVAEGAADRFERLGGYLDQTSGDELLRDVEEFARRRPGWSPEWDWWQVSLLRGSSRRRPSVATNRRSGAATPVGTATTPPRRDTPTSRSAARATARAGEHGVKP